MNFFRRLFTQPAAETASPNALSSAPSLTELSSTDSLLADASGSPLTDSNARQEASVQRSSTDEKSTGEAAHLDEDIIIAAPLNTNDNASEARNIDGVTRPLPPEVNTKVSGVEHTIFAQATDVGLMRTNNQDAMFSFMSTARGSDVWPDFGLFIVADGMGGHHDGEKASTMTMRSVAHHILNSMYLPMIRGAEDANQTPITELMVDAIQKANYDCITKVPDGGTTLTAAVIIGDRIYIAHVGDSRVYWIHNNTIEQVTRDHSLVQRLIELNQLTPEEANDHPQKHVLYKALGQNEVIEVDTLTRRLPAGSRLLICSDGLWNQVPEADILNIISKHSNPQESCSQLIAQANQHGGIDNVTLILLHLPG
ncbi:MAG: PP2C family serine/threonine-protein phosphatase [Aggregatilineales bacterium]